MSKPHTHPQLAWAHPLVQEWFMTKLGAPTAPQIAGWQSILAQQSTLISAPTGSGKTLAAFMICIDGLVRQALDGTLNDQTQVLYVSPLKALSNDIEKNLAAPLAEITELAKNKGLEILPIRVAVRTGDTLAKERQAMLKKPPHILVTTPESIYILLTAEKSRAILQDVKTVIIDEIHAMADDKRGTHLALSLERLAVLTTSEFIRIGLSATQKPLTRVAHFLVGNDRPMPTIVDIGHARQLDLAVEVPGDELGAVASNELWDEIYDRVAQLVQENRSTLVFVNTRRLAERVAHHLAERLGEDQVAAHHGSLSRKLRLAAETKLKNGQLKVLVATASLELGIDIGTIDLVCQLGSPRAIAVALQHIGRAGHWHGAVSKGRIFATTRDELVECAALVYAIRIGDLDQLIMPQEPLDILSQQIIATCATGEWSEDDLFALVKRAAPYEHLKRAAFNSILHMLSEGIAGSRGRYGAYLFRDQVNAKVRAKRHARLTAITSGGAIPENGLFSVIAEPQGVLVGTLDEDFAVESNRGDIILLGTTSWQIRRIENATGRVLVEDAHGAPPSVPFWRGEAPGRSIELCLQVANLRKQIADFLKNHTPETEINQWLQKNCGVENAGAQQIIAYIQQGLHMLGDVPTQQTVIAERFFDEGGGMQLVIHAPFGARINKAWGLALRKRFCRSFNFELQAAATDDGINIALAEQHSFPLADVFNFLHPHTIEDVLVQAVLQSPLFKTRWRWDAVRALALVRFRFGKKVPPNIMRMLSDDLLAAVFPDAAACQDNLAGEDIQLPDHPLINETMKDALNEALDLAGIKQVLENIYAGNIKCIAVDTPTPSPFSHEILNANPYAYLDDAPLEERRARAVEMRRILPPNVLQEVGRLDDAAIQEVKEQAWPDVRSADELHDVLQTMISFPEELIDYAEHGDYVTPHLLRGPDPATLRVRDDNVVHWQEYFAVLMAEGRAMCATIAEKVFWVAAEKTESFKAIYPQATYSQRLKKIEDPVSADIALVNLLRGWLLHLGPTSAAELSQLLAIKQSEIENALLQLETSGFILRGHFRYNDTNIIEWCERRLLARIHRLTLGRLRKEIEPVTAAQFMRWLLRWQHVAPNTQLRGEHGLLEIIKQLQGFEMPANAWEQDIFAKRIKDYDKEMLDHLCLTGVIGWGRFSPHPATLQEETESKRRRVMPTSVAPITFFVRDEAEWMSSYQKFADEQALKGLSHIAKQIYQYLLQRGASFFADIVRGVDHLKAEVETALWELVAAGAITADGFDNLRALIDPKRRADRRGRRIRVRFSTGRWSILHVDAIADYNLQLEAICRMLLKRYGVVFRDLVAREKMLPRWRELLMAFRRLEDRGEIRGGRFVSGFLGEQFALPYAVESLRAIKKETEKNEIVSISAADPMNLIGIILPGTKVNITSAKKIKFENGIWLNDS